jgi:hypothetical protein
MFLSALAGIPRVGTALKMGCIMYAGFKSLKWTVGRLRERQHVCSVATENVAKVAVAEMENLNQLGEDLVAEEPGVQGCYVRSGRKVPFASKVALLCQQRFGLMEDNAANRLIVHKFARDIMDERHVRKSHQPGIQSYVQVLAFQPTGDDILAREMMASRAVREPRERFRAPLLARRIVPNWVPIVGGQQVPYWLPGSTAAVGCGPHQK